MFYSIRSIEPRFCKKCGSKMEKIHRRYSKQWMRKIFDEISNAEGYIEFEIKSGRYQYCIWYCPFCDKI